MHIYPANTYMHRKKQNTYTPAHNMHTICTHTTHNTHIHLNAEQHTEQNTRYNNMQHTEQDNTEQENREQRTEQNTEHSTQHSTQNSAHNYRTYSLDFYHEYAYIKNSNTIELYTILK